MKNGTYFSVKENRIVILYKEKIEKGNTEYCACCGKELKGVAYSILPLYDDMMAEEYYGSECIKKLGLRKA